MTLTLPARMTANRPAAQGLPAPGGAWAQEIAEALDAALEATPERAADPDWQAARRFLEQHCRSLRPERGWVQ